MCEKCLGTVAAATSSTNKQSQLSFLPSDPVHASHQNLPISRQISVSPKSNAVSRHKADKLPRHSTLSPPPALSLSLSFSRAVQVEAYCLANPHTHTRTLTMPSLAPADFKSA